MPNTHGQSSSNNNLLQYHPDLITAPGSRQGTIRSVTPEQLHLFRHLINPQLTTSHQQFHEGAVPSYQRMSSYSSGLPTPLSPAPPYPFRTPGPGQPTGPLGILLIA